MKPEIPVGPALFGRPQKLSPRRAQITVLVVVGLLMVSLIVPLQALTLRLPRKGQAVLAAGLAGTGARLVMIYRHSVEKTLVKGVFEVDKLGRLTAVETRMESTGTGMPNTEAARTRREKGWIVVDEGRKVINDFPFFYQPVNQLKIDLAGRELNISALKAGDVINIAVEKPTLMQWLMFKVLGRSWPLEKRDKRAG